MNIYKKKCLCKIIILTLCLFGCSGNTPEREKGDLQILSDTPDLEQCEELSTALDMLTVYCVKYDETMRNPGEDFWEGFKSALICNSWFGPFSDDNNKDNIWDNERIAAAGSIVTGRELTCTCFPEGVDTSQAYSPYLAWASKVNVHTKPIAKDRFELSYDMMWAPVSMTAIDGMIRVSAIVEVNEDSPLNGYSILKLDHEEVFSCVYEVIGDFDYDVSADNDVIVKSLYQMTDGIHTTKDSENLSELLTHARNKEYTFADMNGDSKNEMIIRTDGYCTDFFFYTDEGILWTKLPVDPGAEIWFTEDYLVVVKDSQPTDESYNVCQIASDGNFERVMIIGKDQEEDGTRFVYVTQQGEKRDITEEEYAYLTEYLESREITIEWAKIL